MNKRSKNIVDSFFSLWYNSKVWRNNIKWLGVSLQKLPLDLWVYQEILFEKKPDIIIETGSLYGGSALFLSSLCELIKPSCQIISIDINKVDRSWCENTGLSDRIVFLTGNSVSKEILSMVSGLVKDKTVMVILDSDHSKEHVLRELSEYSRFVSVGQYLIVEDSCINGHPVLSDFGEGPFEAVRLWLQKNKGFMIDKSREKLLATQNPDGFLLKVK